MPSEGLMSIKLGMVSDDGEINMRKEMRLCVDQWWAQLGPIKACGRKFSFTEICVWDFLGMVPIK